MARAAQKAAANSPFSVVEDSEEEALDQTTQELEEGASPVPLGEAAQQALSEFGDDAAVQDPLDGTDYLKVKFVGMSMDSLEEEIPLGKEMMFLVKARCIGDGNEMSKQDGHIKRFVKMDVSSVQVYDD